MSEYFLRFDPMEIMGEWLRDFEDTLKDGKFLTPKEFKDYAYMADLEFNYEEYKKIFYEHNKKGDHKNGCMYVDSRYDRL